MRKTGCRTPVLKELLLEHDVRKFGASVRKNQATSANIQQLLLQGWHHVAWDQFHQSSRQGCSPQHQQDWSKRIQWKRINNCRNIPRKFLKVKFYMIWNKTSCSDKNDIKNNLYKIWQIRQHLIGTENHVWITINSVWQTEFHWKNPTAINHNEWWLIQVYIVYEASGSNIIMIKIVKKNCVIHVSIESQW